MRVSTVLRDRILHQLQTMQRSQEWLARRLDVTLHQMRQILRGEQDVTVEWLCTVATTLHLPLSIPVPPEMVPLIRGRLAGRPLRTERTQDWLAAQIGMRRSSLTHALRGSAEIPLEAWDKLLTILELQETDSQPSDVVLAARLLATSLHHLAPAQREAVYQALATCFSTQGLPERAAPWRRLLKTPCAGAS